MPTSADASAPNAWESAVRCGTAVIGMMYASGTPIAEPDKNADQDPLRS